MDQLIEGLYLTNSSSIFKLISLLFIGKCKITVSSFI